MVVLSAAAGGWLLFRGGETAIASSTTATVATQTFKQTVTASGTVAAATTADLAFAVSGTVTNVYVKPGDQVSKGQRLAAVDDEVLQAEFDAAQSSLTAGRAARSEDIAAGASDVRLAADKAAVLAAESKLVQAQQAVHDAVLRSTTKGTVTAVGLETGDSVSGGNSSPTMNGASSAGNSSSSSTTTDTITVVSTGKFVVDATVPSADVDKVSVGLQAELTVSGIDETVYGTVQEVGLVAETDSDGAAVFPVTIQVTDDRDDLFGGTSADVSIIVSQRADVLAVDTRALTTEGGKTYVDKVTDTRTGATKRTEVGIGGTSAMATEIVSGLQAGDVVKIAGFAGPGSSGGNSDNQQMEQFRQQMRQNGGTPPGFPGGFSGSGGQ